MSGRDRHTRFAETHAIDPHCHWCGIETWLPVSGDEFGKIRGGPGRHMATTDHLVSRLESPENARSVETVLACAGCNERRAMLAEKALSPDERARRNNVRKFGYVNLRHALAVDPNFLNPSAESA